LVESQLTEIWQRVLANKSIGVNDNFFELGGHSLQAVRMFAEVEKVFGKKIPIGTLFQAGTIKKLAEVLRQNGWSGPESSLVAVQPDGSQPPFFCIHPLGGEVLLYRDLARHLGPDQPFYALRAGRLNGNHMGHGTVGEMASHYIREIQTLQPQGPYLLGGLSFGGLIAFEMAQQLSTQGHKVALLALFDTELFPTTFSSRAFHFGRRLHLHVGRLRLVNFRARVGYVMAGIEKIGRNLSKELNKKYRRAGHKIHSIFKRSATTDFYHVEDEIWRAGQKYVPQVYSGKITLFRADQALGIYPDPLLGWAGIGAGGLEIHEVSGSNHESIVVEPHVRSLAKQLKRCMENAVLEAEQISGQAQLYLVDKTGVHVSLYLAMSSFLI
jgi:thioesterase domain-containing protein/acyl carrier protein